MMRAARAAPPLYLVAHDRKLFFFVHAEAPSEGLMLALLYLAIATVAGHWLRMRLLPGLDGSALSPERRFVGRWVIAWPAAFLIGTLLVTWAVYLLAWLSRQISAPLALANVIVLAGVAFAMTLTFVRGRNRRGSSTSSPPHSETHRARAGLLNVAVLITGLTVGAALMFHTCRLEGDTLVLGRTAFGDLNIHLGMARSFSYGKNFPTSYVGYAGSGIRYHFMFYFLVGNLEYLGLPIDWALNLPSLLSFASALLLLHGLGSTIGRDRRVGALSVLFFLLRSSPAAFVYLTQLHAAGISGRLRELFQTTRFIGLTGNEPWGIWNLNVYVVERHFAFSLGLVLLAVLYLVRAAGLDDGAPLMRPFRVAARIPGSTRG